MTAKQRYDSARISAKIDEHGFLVDRPIVARIGLQVYQTPNGERREFRPASEVFKADSLQSFSGKPVTLGHVTVTPDNAEEVVVGACHGSGLPNGIGVEVPLCIYSRRAIESAKSKRTAEISVGYTSEDVEKPGWGSNETGEFILEEDMKQDQIIPKGWVKFDALQTNIMVNHVAMVFKGRAGIAKLNLDSNQDFPYDEPVISKLKQDDEMKKIKIDSGETVEVTPEVANHIETIQSRATTAEAKATTLEVERDNLKLQVEQIPSKIEAAVNQAKADAAERTKLVEIASAVGVKCDGLDDKQIKIAFVKAVTNRDVSQKDDSYIAAAFDLAKDADPMAEQRRTIKGDVEQTEAKEKSDSADLRPASRLAKLNA